MDDDVTNYEDLSELNEELLRVWSRFKIGHAVCYKWRFFEDTKAKSTRSYCCCSKVQQQEAMQWLQENAFLSTWLVNLKH
jgi:hypothetical protein